MTARCAAFDVAHPSQRLERSSLTLATAAHVVMERIQALDSMMKRQLGKVMSQSRDQDERVSGERMLEEANEELGLNPREHVWVTNLISASEYVRPTLHRVDKDTPRDRPYAALSRCGVTMRFSSGNSFMLRKYAETFADICLGCHDG